MRSTLVLIALAACSSDRSSAIEHPAFGKKVHEPLVAEEAKPAPPPDRDIEIPKLDPNQTGLKFVAKPAAKEVPKPAPPAAIEPLSQNDIEALLARLPPIQTEAEDVKGRSLPSVPVRRCKQSFLRRRPTSIGRRSRSPRSKSCAFSRRATSRSQATFRSRSRSRW
jgi:hypothetical protein